MSRLQMTGRSVDRGRVSDVIINKAGKPELVPQGTLSDDDAKRLVDNHGLRGTLPKTLRRDDRIRAYQARYVVAGGRKGEHWNRKAKLASGVTTGALAVGGAAAGAELASRTKRGQKLIGKIPRITHEGVHHGAGLVGLGAAAVGASGELYRRRASAKAKRYTSATSGVAAGALRRMNDYTPR